MLYLYRHQPSCIYAHSPRIDMVATLGETTAGNTLENMRKQMLLSESGRRILRERPLIHTGCIDFPKLRETCKPGTFGYHYIHWLDQEGVTPDTREPVSGMDGWKKNKDEENQA